MQCPRCYYTNAAGSSACEYCGAQLTTAPSGSGGAASSKRKTVLGPVPGAPAKAAKPRPQASRIDPADPFRIAAEGIAAEGIAAEGIATEAPPPPPAKAPAPVVAPPVVAPPPAAPAATTAPTKRPRPTVITGVAPVTPATRAVAGVALILEDNRPARSMVLHEGRTRIGRRSDLEIVVTAQDASTEHALLRIEDGEAWLLDTSSNGTVVAGRLCLNDRATVTDGTVLRVGDSIVVLKLLSLESIHQLAADA